MTLIEALYGRADSRLSLNPDLLQHLRNISMTKFLEDTHPLMHINYSSFSFGTEEISVKEWKVIKTKIGLCLQFDIREVITSQNRTFGLSDVFSLGVMVITNESDATYGWFGYMRGINVYYNYKDDLVEEDENSLSLSHQLSPTVFFQLHRNSFLAHPYGSCTKRQNLQHHGEEEDSTAGHVVKRGYCMSRAFFQWIYDFCDCFPVHMTDLEFKIKMKNGSEVHSELLRVCDMHDAVFCVSKVIDSNGPDLDQDCEKPCDSFHFRQTHINYRVPPLVGVFDRTKLQMTTAVFKTASNTIKITEQTPAYKRNQLVSDIGGTCGLFLGLSVLKVVMVTKDFLTKKLNVYAYRAIKMLKIKHAEIQKRRAARSNIREIATSPYRSPNTEISYADSKFFDSYIKDN
ncbi:Oidioi.mRNA.OKI2018_I69.chr1.g1206.t1.cds [Oikopleura dioica]|uniref:Oidioi.mRNA.OKI2018_I69.chr1.g1206.t1.cds n=1 Tax=Oikopleura dioica TaxID=34765 RepID=A0ABN7SMR1_OIKDI|nr:Oidioi.mRNA.OKI2018_I69.chr1.g1206.t1.cds [Oikopleura dioica]